jgi:3-hydroxyisobutyrate dehydrogenase-like beta-hydroxyacid dehydrogenase
MGAAIARTLSQRGSKVTVWNRTTSAADALIDFGIEVAATPAAAFEASDLTIVCVLDHDVALGLLREACLSVPSLAGRLVVEMSSSTPAQARQFFAEAVEHGGVALDANIMCYPAHIGTEEAMILYAGPRTTLETAGPTLRALGVCRHAGEDPGAARIIAKTAASVYFASHAAFAEAYAAALALGADPEAVLSVSLMMNQLAGEGIKVTADRYRSGSSDDVDVRLLTLVQAAEPVLQTIRSAGMPGLMPGAAIELMRQGLDAGRDYDDLAGLVDVLLTSARTDPSSPSSSATE